MRHLYRHTVLVLAVILLSVWAILPPEQKLRRAKDLAGGASLIYQVELKPTDPANTVDQVIELLKKRVDPDGVLDITMVKQGSNRIEITMPLPGEKVKALRAEFDKAVDALGQGSLTADQLQRVLAMPEADRAAAITTAAAGDAERQKLLTEAAAAADEAAKLRTQFAASKATLAAAAKSTQDALDGAMAAAKPETELAPLRAARDAARSALDEAALGVAKAEQAAQVKQEQALATTIPAQDVRRVFELSDKDSALKGAKPEDRKVIPSPRKEALARLKRDHPAAAARIDNLVELYANYSKQRSSLDDPQDLVRVLKGAGVLEFRIAVKPGQLPEEQRLREELRKLGPRGVKFAEARWYKLNKLDGWYNTEADYNNLRNNTAAYMAAQYRMVGEMFDNEPYVLLLDVPGSRLTQAEGSWKCESARRSSDDLGRPAIGFGMDQLGAEKMRALTGANIGNSMAVLLDDQVFTAPNINSAIGRSGIIQGVFTEEEINYVVRVLAAGSLAAKLSPEPISVQTIGPELGADNLTRGLTAGLLSFVLVSGFMIAYYWAGGVIAVIALAINGLLILALMSINRAAFSLPGIAGVILTFGMAVDANVLVFERMREEEVKGADLRTSVRLGYSKALSAIIDGNVTNLIVCVVLAFTGTQEIKSFAITMSIGVITTMFAQLYITRIVYYWLTERLRWRRMSMLPLAVPFVQRLITPNIDWMKWRWFAYITSGLLTVVAVYAVVARGERVLDNEFRGGTKITMALKKDANGQQLKMTRGEVQAAIEKIEGLSSEEQLRELRQAEVLAINPDADRVTSSVFVIKTVLKDPAVPEAITRAFADKLDIKEPLTFTGAGVENATTAPIRPIVVPNLGDNIDRPTLRYDAAEFIGGAAITLSNLGPTAPSKDELDNRLRQLRGDPQFAENSARRHEWVVLEGDDNAVRSAVLLVRDDNISYLNDQQRWATDLKQSEWLFVNSAMSRKESLAGVEVFSASIARTFFAQAIVAVALSTLMIIIYVWVRFNSFRYSAAAMLATFHDCFIAVGAIAAAEVLCSAFPQFSASIGLMPFKIDLNVVAAVLTLLGYSLNDTIVIMDRIRENRGKLPFASREIINRSINQTFSRMIMTHGSVVVAVMVLYIGGGEGIRPFAFCFVIGVFTGSYSSVAIAAPLVWSRKLDPHEGDAPVAPRPPATALSRA